MGTLGVKKPVKKQVMDLIAVSSRNQKGTQVRFLIDQSLLW